MKHFASIVALTTLLLFACKNEIKEKVTESPAIPDEEKKNYFPVQDYIKGEIAYVDSFPMKMMKFSNRNGHKDSSLIKLAEFDRLSAEFLDPQLEKSNLEKDFSESSFLDQTSQSLTFTYSRKKSQDGIRRIDVLAAQDPAHDKVKSVYIEKVNTSGDSTILKKMFWQSKKNFQILTVTQIGQQPDIINQSKVVWDNRQ